MKAKLDEALSKDNLDVSELILWKQSKFSDTYLIFLQKMSNDFKELSEKLINVGSDLAKKIQEATKSA